MVIEREQLLRHFKRIYCNGEIPEVALSGPFRATAISRFNDLLVVTAGLSGAEPLPHEIGLLLDKVMQGFCCTKGQHLEVEQERDSLVLSFSNGRLRVPTIPADMVYTRMNEDFVQQALALVPDDAWQSFDRSVAAGVVQAIRVLSPDRVALRTTPDGTTVIVGDERYALEFDTSDVKSDHSYGLLFSTHLLRSVFQELANADGEIAFTGPNAVLGVRIGVEVTYVISPQEETRGPRGNIPHAPSEVWNRVGT